MSICRLNATEFKELADQILKTGHSVSFQARGLSMLPFIQDGDILEVAPLNGMCIKYADVVLAKDSEERLLAHRVIKIDIRNNNPFYLLKGDACIFFDGWFQLDNILGRVEIVNRGGKRIDLLSGLQSWRGKLWIMIAPWAPKLSWLPVQFRRFFRIWLLGS